MIREKLFAQQAAHRFRQRAGRQFAEALAGDGLGNLGVADRPDWIWVRLAGDADQVIQAHLESWIGLYEDDPVLLEKTGSGYSLIGFSPGISFDLQYSDASQYQMNRLVSHARQHERDDKGVGGNDPLNVYPRMFVPLRARAQDTPDLTLKVQRGLNPLTGTWLDDTDSPAFVPPAHSAFVSAARIDLLYLGADDALHILQGTTTTDGSIPGFPALPVPSVPLAFVYLLDTTASLTEYNIERDPRLLVGALGVAGSAVALLGDAIGPANANTVIQASGAFALTGIITPTALTGNTNDYDPPGLASASALLLSATTDVNLTGLAGGAPGRVLTVRNVGSHIITLKNEDAASTATKRFSSTADAALAPNDGALLQYDGTRWGIAGKSAVSGSGGGGDVPVGVPASLPAVGFVQLYALASSLPNLDFNRIPYMTGASTPFGTASASNSLGSVSPWQAMADPNSAYHGWLNNGGSLPEWLQYQFPSGLVIAGYGIIPWSIDNFPGRSPVDWELQGSNNGSSWTTLDSQTGFAGWVLDTITQFSFANTTAYEYYRLNITANGGNAYVGVKRLELYALSKFEVFARDSDGYTKQLVAHAY